MYFYGGCNFVYRKVLFFQTSIQFKLTLPGRDTQVKLSNPLIYRVKDRGIQIERTHCIMCILLVGCEH